MTIRVRYRIELAVSSTDAEERDLGDVKIEVVDDTQGDGGVRKFKIPAGTTDLSISMGDITTARVVFLKTQPVDPNNVLPEVRIRKLAPPGGEQILINPLGTAKEAHLLLITTGVSAIYVTNTSSTVDVYLTVGLVGD